MSVVVVAVSVVMVVVLGSVVVVVVVLVIVVVVVAVVVAVCAVGRFRHAAVLGGVGVTVVAAVVALAWLSVVLVSLVAWVVGLASSFAMNMDMLEGSPACLVNAFHVSFLFFFASALIFNFNEHNNLDQNISFLPTPFTVHVIYHYNN